MKLVVLLYSESYLQETKYILVKFNHFSCIKNTIERIAFENAYELSIIFQPFLYANVPAESPSYAPTFKFQLSLGLNQEGICVFQRRIKIPWYHGIICESPKILPVCFRILFCELTFQIDSSCTLFYVDNLGWGFFFGGGGVFFVVVFVCKFGFLLLLCLYFSDVIQIINIIHLRSLCYVLRKRDKTRKINT